MQGIREAMAAVVSPDTRSSISRRRVVDGSYHDVDSKEVAYKIAGSLALKEALRRGKPVILEPIMKVEVTTPEEFMGDVIGDLNSRRGQIQGMEMRAGAQVIRANVPLAQMFGYATDLRSATQGPRRRTRWSSITTRRCRSSIAEEMVAKARRRLSHRTNGWSASRLAGLSA